MQENFDYKQYPYFIKMRQAQARAFQLEQELKLANEKIRRYENAFEDIILRIINPPARTDRVYYKALQFIKSRIDSLFYL